MCEIHRLCLCYLFSPHVKQLNVLDISSTGKGKALQVTDATSRMHSKNPDYLRFMDLSFQENIKKKSKKFPTLLIQ